MSDYTRVTIMGETLREVKDECANYMTAGFTLISRRLYVQWPRVWKWMWIAEMDNKIPEPYKLTDPDPQPESIAVPMCLQDKLQKALEEENYEEAARLREIIKNRTK